MRHTRCLVQIWAASLLLVLTSTEVTAQEGPALTLLGGPSSYDLSGVGTSWVAGSEAEFSPLRHLGIVPGLRFFRYETQRGVDASYLLPELTLRLQVPGGRFQPYLGGGGGGTMGVEGRPDDDFTLHAAVGTHVRLEPSWSLRPEFRVRSVDPWIGSMGDFTLGVTYRP